MSVAEKALWMIETRAGPPARLDEIAAACGVSRFHLTRAFAEAFGLSLIAYRNARRLSDAAERLAYSDASVTEVALDAGYEAPEAFARAFRAAFGAAPSEVRAFGSVARLPLTQPPRLEDKMTVTLTAPRIEEAKPLRVAGLARDMTMEDLASIPGLWAEFAPHFGSIEGQVGEISYGLCRSLGEGRMTYMAGVEVAPGAMPAGLEIMEVPAQRCAVWRHEGHISDLRHAFAAIFDRGLKDAGLTYADGVEFELYDERFDPRTGTGGLEIWIPVE